MTVNRSIDQPAQVQAVGLPGSWWNVILVDFGIKPDKHTGNYSTELKTLAGLYLVVLAVFLLFMRGHFLSTDHVAVYQVTQSLIEDHDLSIDPILNTVLGPDGQYYSVFGLGQSIFSIPFYLVGKWADQFSPPVLRAYWGGENLGIWGGTVPIYFVSTFNQFVMPLVCTLVYLFSRQLGFSRRHSLMTSLILAFGTLAFSQAVEHFQHPLESLLLLLAIYILFTHRDNLQERHTWLAGIFLGIGILTRINLLFLYPVLVVYIWYLSKKANDPGNGPIKFAYFQCFSIPVLLSLIIIFNLNQIRFGNFLIFNPTIMNRGWVDPLWTGIYGYFFSLGRSLFLYSPPLLAAMICWPVFFSHHKTEARLFLVIFLVFLATYVFYADWAGGWCWGPRYLLAIVPLFILPLGYCWETKRKLPLAILLTILGVCIQLLGSIINYGYVHGDWERMGFTYPLQEYIFIPRVSPIVMHLQALMAGQYIDTWRFWVYQQYGPLVFLGSLILPLALLITGISFLRQSNAHPKESLLESH